MREISEIKEQLLQNIAKDNVIFVFSTDVVKNSWIDWIVSNPQLTGTNTVPLERFVAWDNFKSSFISAAMPGMCVIPSLLRKLFVSDLICKNSQEPFFKKIISPEFAKNASGFKDWLCDILPSLELWHKKFESLHQTPDAPEPDDEDADFLELYTRYSEFLSFNKMFEPSWVIPDFSGQDLQFVVFYPEIYDDYADYVEILNNNKNITVVHCNKTQGPLCYRYADSRQELRRTLLQLRELVHPSDGSEPKCNWDEISFSVPDLKTYRPYLEREFTKYCIPFVIRAGSPLTQNCAGQIFSEIKACKQSDFSYNSMRAFLLDEYIPWKNTASENGVIYSRDIYKSKMNLIEAARDLRCICNIEELNGQKIDIWEKALSASGYDSERRLYSNVKHSVKKFCEAKSFAEIQKQWNTFKTDFIDTTKFTAEANQILGRCITHLSEMEAIEKEYGEKNNFSIENHFDFFISELESKIYTPQTTAVGVNIYPYKLSAQANFKYQFVIDGSQKNLEIPFKRLNFLSSEKRSLLGLLEEDKHFNASQIFIALYNQNSNQDVVRFSYAEDTFDGFAIPHTYFQMVQNPQIDGEEQFPNQQFDKFDFYLNEKKLLLEGKIPEDKRISAVQKERFEKWKQINEKELPEYSVGASLKEKIEYTLFDYRKDGWQKSAVEQGIEFSEDEKKIIITQTDLKNFFPCQRQWLFKNVLHLCEDSLGASLMEAYDFGNIYHKILEIFFEHYKMSGEPLPVTNYDGVFDDEDKIKQLLRPMIEKGINEADKTLVKSPLVMTMLESQREIILVTILNFLHEFCKLWNKKGGFGNFTVKEAEGWKAGTSKDESVRYTGKLDCVLVSPDSDIFIIDFKTGETPKFGECVASLKDSDDPESGLVLKDFQIPMYLSVYNAGNNSSINKQAENAYFYSINKLEPTPVVYSMAQKNSARNLRSFEEYGSSMELFETYIQRFREKIESDDFEPVYDEKDLYNSVDKIELCKGCHFKSVCRSNYSIGQREVKTNEQ